MDLFIKLWQIIQFNKAHTHRQHCIDKANLYKALMLGQGDEFNKLAKRFIPSEETEIQNKILDIVNPITKPVCHRLCSIDFKIPRSNSVIKVLSYEGSDGAKKAKEFSNVYLSKFWGNKSIDDYFAVRFFELAHIDPNAWVVIEWPASDGKTVAVPFPHEIPSANVIDWSFENEILKYLVCKEPLFKDPVTGKNADLEKFTIYGTEATVIFEQTTDQSYIDYIGENSYKTIDGFRYVKINGKLYKAIEPEPHKLGYIPAFRCGNFRDQETDGETFVNIFDKALPYILGSIALTINRDLVNQSTAFPQRWQYEKACNNEDCLNGSLRNGGKCPDCGGTGTLVRQTAWHTITFPLPKTKDEFFALGDMVHFHYPDPAILSSMNQYVEDVYWKCVDVIYNAESISRQQIAQAVTATEKIIANQSKYDVIYPVAINEGKSWTFAVETIATVIGWDKGLTVEKTYKKDFNLNSRVELVSEYDEQVKAGLPSEITDKTLDEIVQMDSASNPDQYEAFSVKKKFMPFSGRTPEQISQILSGGDVRRRDKILYNNWSAIWAQLEAENQTVKDDQIITIYKMPSAVILQKLNDVITKYISEIDAEKPKTIPFNQI